MGEPMATNLLRGGHPLTVFDLSHSKCGRLGSQGAQIAESPQEVGRDCNVVITVLPDTAAVEQALFGESGVAKGLERDATVIDMSTISPTAAEDLARRIEALGCEMLDAPVSGGERGAREGTLSIMVGGRREVFEKHLATLQLMGKVITYTGPSGNGQKTKLVNQLVGATNLLAAVEGIRLARAAGLDPVTTLQAVSNGAASSWMLVNLGPLILKEHFAPGFSIRLQDKDMRLLNDWVSDLGGDFPAAQLVGFLFRKAMEMGLENQGNQGLINVWAQDDLKR
jgi:3-hydroxyisobutyrate dehydrogenase